MRWFGRCLLVAGALALLPAIPSAASADEMYLGIRSVECSSVTVSGNGLPASTAVILTVTDGVHHRQLDRQTLTTSSTGSFLWHARISLSGLRSVRAAVARPGASRPIAWTEHQVPSACPLVNTGAAPALPLVGMGFGSILVGLLLVIAFAYRGRHLGLYQGRHLAAR